MSSYKTNKLILFLLVIAALLPLSAQTRILTKEEAINIALKNNRDVKIADLNVKKAEAAVREAFGYALPSVDVTGEYHHFLETPKMAFPDFAAMLSNATYSILFDEGVIPRDDSKYQPMGYSMQSFSLENNFTSTVQATQVLFNSAVFRGIGTSQIYLDLSKEELKRAVSNTVLEVEKTFHGVLLSKELYSIAQASFDNSNDNLRNVKALYDQGLVSEFDYLQAQVRVENIRPVLLQMENNLSLSKDGFKILLGVEQAENIDVTGEFEYSNEEIPDEETTIKNALDHNFALNSMKMKLKVDDAFIDLDRADYWPSLAAFANYNYAGASNNFNFQTYTYATVGLSFQMNLFKGTRTKNRVEQSEISLSQSNEQLSQLKDYVVSQVKFRLNELRKVKASLEAQEQNVNVAQKAYDLSVVRYKEGTGSQLEIINQDVALRQAKINRLQSLYDYIISKANLDQLLGRLDAVYYNQFDFND